MEGCVAAAKCKGGSTTLALPLTGSCDRFLESFQQVSWLLAYATLHRSPALLRFGESMQIPAFAKARVLVAGDVMLDRYWHGPTGRISPEAPVPVVRVTELEDRPGGAANVALNMAALGARAELVGITGDDEAAAILEERLGAAEVGCHFQKIDGLPTITKLRVISRQQQLLRRRRYLHILRWRNHFLCL